MLPKKNLIIRNLGRQAYEPVWQEMLEFTHSRNRQTRSEIWLVEHDPVFTQGQAGKAEHILAPGEIEVVQTDRGGQVTYHGPGQLVIYLLLNLHEAGIGIRQLVTIMENSVIDFLAQQGLEAVSRKEAPGVYLQQKKIAALGLRVRHGYTYHGLSFNIDLDLEPFQRINPCGFENLEVTRLCDHGINLDFQQVSDKIVAHLLDHLHYRAIQISHE